VSDGPGALPPKIAPIERPSRPYLFYDATTSVCSTCLMRVEAKVLIQDERVILEKWCRHHGRERVLLADDVAYWRNARETFLKPAEMPFRFQTKMEWGCPYDCGICPDHQQHACLALVEINDRCNLTCPICFAGSGVHRTEQRTLAEVEKMLDTIVTAERRPDVVQISGGEPTLHPELFAILDLAMARPIRHVMLNTNGLRIAQDPELARRLAAYGRRFEVYLQFDSLRDESLMTLRGANLADVRRRALQNLDEADVSTTLVVTVARGVNDDQLGEILTFAASLSCVRGVTLQPVQEAGRHEGYDPAKHRLTLTEVRRRVLEQYPTFTSDDLVPVPCHPDALCMGYALKHQGTVVPLTRYAKPADLLAGPTNTIVLEDLPDLKAKAVGLFSTGIGPDEAGDRLKDLLCCLPRVEAAGLTYKSVFRVLIVRFSDARDLDVRSVKRSCIFFATPEGKLVPFDTYNLFYRRGQEGTLARLRAAVDRSWGDAPSGE
jgi:7,8-dihydro-6-hydroxymethylpterin dimethyltransferase